MEDPADAGPGSPPGEEGAVRRAPSSKHITWDEKNLAENESIQAQFAGVSVPEPKTPYHGPSPPDELEDDLRPLALGDDDGRPLTAFDYALLANGALAGGASPPGGGSSDAGGDVAGAAAAAAAAAVGRSRVRSDSGSGGAPVRPRRGSWQAVVGMPGAARARSAVPPQRAGRVRSTRRRCRAARPASARLCPRSPVPPSPRAPLPPCS
jgi:hypothetical protein